MTPSESDQAADVSTPGLFLLEGFMTQTEPTTTGDRKLEIGLGTSADANKFIDGRSGYLEGCDYVCTGAIAWVWPDGHSAVTLYLSRCTEPPDQRERLDFESISGGGDGERGLSFVLRGPRKAFGNLGMEQENRQGGDRIGASGISPDHLFLAPLLYFFAWRKNGASGLPIELFMRAVTECVALRELLASLGHHSIA
jgi:hypothetical protein